MGIFSRGRPSFQTPPKSLGEYRVVGPESDLKYIGSAVDLLCGGLVSRAVQGARCQRVTGFAGRLQSRA